MRPRATAITFVLPKKSLEAGEDFVSVVSFVLWVIDKTRGREEEEEEEHTTCYRIIGSGRL